MLPQHPLHQSCLAEARPPTADAAPSRRWRRRRFRRRRLHRRCRTRYAKPPVFAVHKQAIKECFESLNGGRSLQLEVRSETVFSRLATTPDRVGRTDGKTRGYLATAKITLCCAQHHAREICSELDWVCGQGRLVYIMLLVMPKLT